MPALDRLCCLRRCSFLGTTTRPHGMGSFRDICFTTCTLSQATLLPRRYYTTSWHGEALASTHGHMFRNIIMRNSRPSTLPHAALISQRSTLQHGNSRTWSLFEDSFFKSLRPTSFSLGGTSTLHGSNDRSWDPSEDSSQVRLIVLYVGLRSTVQPHRDR